MSDTPSRQSTHSISRIFIDRWSPRAFTGEDIPDGDLFTIFEAARWAPSSFNGQPWRFVYAKRGSARWPTFLDLLVPFNQSWAERASVLIIGLSKTTTQQQGKDVPSITHSFDAGAAWACLALQASLSGWHAHGMAGFDRERALQVVEAPTGFDAEVAIAIGRKADPELLPESLRAREFPSARLALDQIVAEGSLRGLRTE